MELHPFVRIVELPKDAGAAFYNLEKESIVVLPHDLSVAVRDGHFEELSSHELAILTEECIVTASADKQRHDFLLTYASRWSPKGTLSASVCVTTECNLACPYCFQRGDQNRQRMNADTARDVAADIIARAKQTHATKVGVTFTGGEPLLNLDAVRTVAETVGGAINQAADRSVFTYDITTNGTLLTPLEVSRLRMLGLCGLQVTLEGCATIHDQRRAMRNGGGTYQRIKDNLRGLEIPTCINVILDHQAGQDIVSLVHDLASEVSNPSNFEFAFSFRVGVPGLPSPFDRPVPLSRKEQFVALMPDFFDAALTCGFSIARPGFGAACVVLRDNSAVFKPDGQKTACVNMIGNMHVPPRLSRTKGWEAVPFAFAQNCRECSLVPVCFCGCRFENLSTENPFEAPHCEYAILAGLIDAYVRSIAVHEAQTQP